MCILSAVVCLPLIVLAGIGFSDTSDRNNAGDCIQPYCGEGGYYHYRCTSKAYKNKLDEYQKCPERRRTSHTNLGIQIIVALVTALSAIFASSISCQVVCSGKQRAHPENDTLSHYSIVS